MSDEAHPVGSPDHEYVYGATPPATVVVNGYTSTHSDRSCGGAGGADYKGWKHEDVEADSVVAAGTIERNDLKVVDSGTDSAAMEKVTSAV